MSALHARSLLFVPGDRPERFDKAADSGADAIIIDLEDAVRSDNKPAALSEALAWLDQGREAIVRINGAGTSWHADELSALAGSHATVMVPKSESPEELASVSSVLGGDRIIALVETALGVRDADRLACAPGVIRLALGNVDLGAELGVDPDSHPALAYSRGRIVVGSVAAGIGQPIDGVTRALDSPASLAADLAVTRDLGFGGKLCIHPRQVDEVNRALRPTDAELAWARNVLESAGDTQGVTVLDGVMIDAPVLSRARFLLSQA
jgi:citrate lyase subunit beta/citryl-CoA lyase